MRILFLTPQLPYPPRQGASLRNFHLLRHLSERHEVHLLSFGEPRRLERESAPLREVCQSVAAVVPPTRRTGRRLWRLLSAAAPDLSDRGASAEMEARLAAVLERVNPDVVQVEGLELGGYLRLLGARKGFHPRLVLDEHNAEYALQWSVAMTDLRSGRVLGALYSLVQWAKLRRFERESCLQVDRVVCVSMEDAAHLRRLDSRLDPLVVPNGVDCRSYPPATAEAPREGRHVLFVGSLDYRPNLDAVLWFARRIWPLVAREEPTARFSIVGRHPPASIRALEDHGSIAVIGEVKDVVPHLARADVCVVPLRMGSGVRLKVLEALAMGRAVVSTELGCAGLPVANGREVVLADGAGAFAAAVVGLLRDARRRVELGRRGRQLVQSQFAWEDLAARLEAAHAELVGGKTCPS